MKHLPTCPIPDIARLGRTLRKWKDAHLASCNTAAVSNAPRRSHQRIHRTRQTHHQRLPQPHQLPAPNAPHRRRPRCHHPHPTLKSLFPRLNYTAQTHLHLSRVEVGLMMFGKLLDFIDCWRLETGRAKPARIWFIDDIIPAGI